MIGLVDCNNFFASCERVFNPQLEGKPIIVLSSNDGCVVARSNEAKALGIPMGIPLFKIRELVEREHVVIRSSNFELYGDLSHRIMNLIKRTFPMQEVYSIDECFFQADGIQEVEEVCQKLRNDIKKGIGIPISIGLAPNKTLAKIASHRAKKMMQYNGIYTIDSEDKRLEIIGSTPINDVWGIGRRYEVRLKSANITTALHFAQQSHEWVQSNFGSVLGRTHLELQGHMAIPLELGHAEQQSITRSRTFAQPISNKEKLLEVLMHFVDLASTQLRIANLEALRVGIFIEPSRFRSELAQYRKYAETPMDAPSSHLSSIARYISPLLDAIYHPNIPYKKAGIIFPQLQPKHLHAALFESETDRKGAILDKTIDKLRQRYGQKIIYNAIAPQGVLDEVVTHHTISPRHSTRLSEVITIKAVDEETPLNRLNDEKKASLD